ncbi:MAG TPA: zinc-binding dehydrogenase [Candidatus Krumholzibacteria bacterium]
MKAVVFDGAIPKYLATRAIGAVSKSALMGPGQCMQLKEVPPPLLPNNRWVRIATRMGGICGSDVSLVTLSMSPSTSPFSSFPFVVGHENVGTVIEIGAAVTRVAVGDRVVANPLLACRERGIDPPCAHCAAGAQSRCEHFADGALAPGMILGTTKGLGGSWGEQYVAHEGQLLPIDAGVPDKLAVLIEPLACVVAPILHHPVAEGARVLVIGAGSMGLLTVAALKVLASANVTVLCRHRFQAEHAERLGADRVVMTRDGDYFAELSRLTNSRLLKPILGPRINVGGFDASYVCVGNDVAVSDGLRFTRSGGTVIMLGNVAKLGKVDWTPLWLKELSVHGSLCYHGGASHGAAGSSDFAAAARLVFGPLRESLEPLVTHVVPLDRARDAVMIALGRSKERAVKVALEASNSA